MLLEHPPACTAGRRTQPHERPVQDTPVITIREALSCAAAPRDHD